MSEPYWRDEKRDLTIYHGDCREVMREFTDGQFGSVITDPPYGVEKEGYLDVPPDTDILGQCLSLSSGVVVMWGGAPVRSQRHFLMLEPPPMRTLIWAPKSTESFTVSNGIQWRWHAIYCWRLPKKNGVVTSDVMRESSDCFHHTWEHPAMRPEAPMIRLVAAFGRAPVLDPYVGTGTTLAVCAKLGLPGVGIEISEEYCEMAAARLSDDVTYGEEPNLFTMGGNDE